MPKHSILNYPKPNQVFEEPNSSSFKTGLESALNMDMLEEEDDQPRSMNRFNSTQNNVIQPKKLQKDDLALGRTEKIMQQDLKSVKSE